MENIIEFILILYMPIGTKIIYNTLIPILKVNNM